MKKVFLENLPLWEYGLGNKGTINWQKCIGYNVKFIYEDIEGEFEIVDYNIENQDLFIKYLDKPIFKIKTGHLTKCKLGNLLVKKSSEFKIEVDTKLKDDKRDLIITDREYRENTKGQNYKYYKYKCNKCGWDEGWMTEGGLLKGYGCACCCFNPRIVAQGINDIPTTASWMVKFFQGGYDEAKLYTKSSSQKIHPICPDCGRIKNKEIAIYNIYRTHSISCSCGDGFSYPNKFMYALLEQLNIDFTNEYSPKWISPKRYDFYFELKNKKYIVEMDGYFHNNHNNLNGQTKDKSIELDNYKDSLAKEHNIDVIRIDSSISELDFIKKNILNSKLINLFNLDDVDWLKCENFALSNLVKMVCEYKNNNPNLSTIDIGKIINLSQNTIIRFLKKGNKLEWCSYNPKEEYNKGRIKSGEMYSKKVEIFQNEVSLGVFSSCHELDRKSEELFGIKLDNRSISRACRNGIGRYKGFVLKYVN